jgi:hypothetical protein
MKIIFTVCTALVFFSSCASYMSARSSGDAKSGINIVTSDSITVTLSKNNIPLPSKMIFDGRGILFLLSVTDLTITANNKTQSVHITRQKDEGWFWIDGLMVWMYESIAGKLTYYDDLSISHLFKNN